MSIYDSLGVRTIINVAGSSTRVGGALMPRQVVEAMSQAAEDSVSMAELQAAASRHISKATGAEAGYVTSGASAGLTLGTAAIMAGLDPGKMDRLPDTAGTPSEPGSATHRGAGSCIAHRNWQRLGQQVR